MDTINHQLMRATIQTVITIAVNFPTVMATILIIHKQEKSAAIVMTLVLFNHLIPQSRNTVAKILTFLASPMVTILLHCWTR